MLNMGTMHVGDFIIQVPNAKLLTLLSLTESVGMPIIVFCPYSSCKSSSPQCRYKHQLCA